MSPREQILALSLFPGIGLLDRAFEEEGYCVARGPDLLWGGDIRRFHPPAGKFDGVIGGPPCQAFSALAQAQRKGLLPLAKNLIPEFERCVDAAQPDWFLMENVPMAPIPAVPGYVVVSKLLNNRWLGEVQSRVRRFSFGTRNGARLIIDYAALEHIDKVGCVTANGTQWDKDGNRSRSDRTVAALARYLELQGLPTDYLDHAPFTVEAKVRIVGNGVPLAMGRAIARAVKRAIKETNLAPSIARSA